MRTTYRRAMEDAAQPARQVRERAFQASQSAFTLREAIPEAIEWLLLLIGGGTLYSPQVRESL
jgi:hypothetical protein